MPSRRRRFAKSFQVSMKEDLFSMLRLLRKQNFDEIFNFIDEKNDKELSQRYKFKIEIYLPIDGLGANNFVNRSSSAPKEQRVRVDMRLEFSIDESSCDPFSSYQCNIEFFFHNDSRPCFAWHLDREKNTDGDFVHPRYHFQVGGRSMDGVEYGDISFFSSPRIPHPPMDAVLLLHFMIQNFINSGKYDKKKDLLKDQEYQDLIEQAQVRVLNRYFEIINSGKSSCGTLTAYELFPLMGCSL